MANNGSKRNLLAAFVGGAILVGIGAGASRLVNRPTLSPPPPLASSEPIPPVPKPLPVIFVTAAQSLAKCGALAADPNDPSRGYAPVPDEQFAPGLAISACEEAVTSNPENATALFQLGRSYWIGQRYDDAFKYFVLSATKKYPIAEKYLGDAYFTGHVPAGQQPSADTAAQWYSMALDAGITIAADPLKLAQTKMRQSSFDYNRDGPLFQARDYIEALYTGDLSSIKSPVGLAYYAQGLVSGLDDDGTRYIDVACKPLSNAIGNFVLNYSQIAAFIKLVSDSQNLDDDEKGRMLARGAADWLGGDQWAETGQRDASILYNKDYYGCDSAVTRKILNHIMVKLNIGDDSTITVENTK